MNEILDILYNYPDTESDADVFIGPRDVREITDEDSVDENGISNFPHPIRIRKIFDVDSYGVDYDLSLPKIRKTTAKSYKCTNKRDYRQNISIFPEPNKDAYRVFSPVELFELFFDENLIDMII